MTSNASATPFECTVCYQSRKESSQCKKIICRGCEYTVCSKCQKQYGKTECMNCHLLIQTKTALELLGKQFVSQTVKKNKITELMAQQKRELESIGELVEWTKEQQQIKKNNRYDIRVRFNESKAKPTRSSYNLHIIGACPINDCHGSITTDENKCTICKTAVCADCFCVKKDQHTCDPQTKENVKDIRENTKPCPKCNTPIYKISGCSHMHCTKCDCHFNWDHLTILINSTNHHYRHLVGPNVRNGIFINPPQNDDLVCAVSMDTDRIPKDILLELIRNTEIQSHIPQQLIKTLYDTTKTVRFLYIAEYEEVKIAKTSRDKYDELQIKFAMNEISEKQWEIQVYHTHIKQQSHELIAGILNVYLANMDGFQSKLYAYISDYSQKSRNPLDLTNFIAELSEEITCLTNIINENIQDIRNDYDPKNTTILKIRNMGEIDIGDCSLQTENPKKTRTKPKEIFEKKDIKLYEYQFKHVEKLNKILENTHYALDLSPLGTGKTYSASKIFQMGQEQGKYRHIITISPPSVKTKWLEVNQLYGLNCQANLTYGDLIGKKFHQPKSGYLIRNDFKVSVIHKDGQLHLIDKTEFTTTQLFNQLVEEGLLLVIDEFHYLKNESSQTEAAEAMITNIYQESKNGGKSRVLLMSGSPIDKMQQTTRLFKTLGIMKHTMIVSRFHSAGIDEIIDYINKTFPQNPRLLPYQRENYYIRDSINSVLRRIGGDYWYGSADKCIIYVYKIFINVVKVKASSSMNLNEIQQSGVVLKKYNGYFVLNEEKNREKMEMAISELSKIENAQISHFSRNMGGGGGRTRNEVNDMMAQLVRTMTIIETAKIDTFARLTRQQLTENPQKKVVIGVNYSATLYDLENLLREFKPLVINGSTSIKRRQTILKQFQEPSTEHRLLIGNVSVISTGIDLDDKHGNFPRVCYVSPNYNTIHIYQLSHRFLRGLDTKSNAEIYMVYSNHTQERRILESLAVKSNIMKTVTIEQAEAGVVFPCDYETHYEELGNIVELINEKLDKNP